MQPICTWFSLKQRVIYQANKLHYFAKNSQSKLRIIKSQEDLQSYLSLRQKNKNITAGLLSIEGLHSLEHDAKNVEVFAKNGFRVMGLTHLFDNDVGGSSYGEVRHSLTEYGKEVLLEIKKHQLIIDLAHASPKLIDSVIQFYHNNHFNSPIIASHTGAIGASPHHRNLSDKHLVDIAKTNGVICIGYFPPAIPYPHPEQIAKSIMYVVDTLNQCGLNGIDHVGLGSDFDGGVTVPFDTTGIILITEALMSPKYGLKKEDIYKIMGWKHGKSIYGRITQKMSSKKKRKGKKKKQLLNHNLELYGAWINSDWQSAGSAFVLLARKRPSGFLVFTSLAICGDRCDDCFTVERITEEKFRKEFIEGRKLLKTDIELIKDVLKKVIHANKEEGKDVPPDFYQCVKLIGSIDWQVAKEEKQQTDSSLVYTMLVDQDDVEVENSSKFQCSKRQKTQRMEIANLYGKKT